MGGGSGSSYVFVRSGETWTHQAMLLASDGVLDDEFGYLEVAFASVAIYGDTIVVGAPNNGDYSGSAYVFSALV